jgi:hypothetical protein
MSRRRTKLSIAIVLVILLLLGAAIYLRKEAPPEAARLLPESDGIVYVNLRPLRAATHFDQHPVQHSPDYQHFIDVTGIEFERDLDEAAFALHRMADPNGPNGPVAFSEVFVGHFDGRKLESYLSGIGTAQDVYAGHRIYSIPSEGRTVRVAALGYDVVAVSNTPSTEQIHSIIDRYRTAALPFSGSSLLSKHYAQIPLLASAWGIGQIALPLGKSGGIHIMGVRVPVPVDATLIASLSWAGHIHLKVEEYAPNERAAADTAESVQTVLTLVKAMQAAHVNGPFNPEMQSLLSSIEVERHETRVQLTATVPSALLQHWLDTPQEMEHAAEPAPAPLPAAKPQAKPAAPAKVK